MKPTFKTGLIAIAAGAVYGGVNGALTAIYGEPHVVSKGIVFLVVVIFAIEIANKSDVQPPEEDQSD